MEKQKKKMDINFIHFYLRNAKKGEYLVALSSKNRINCKLPLRRRCTEKQVNPKFEKSISNCSSCLYAKIVGMDKLKFSRNAKIIGLDSFDSETEGAPFEIIVNDKKAYDKKLKAGPQKLDINVKVGDELKVIFTGKESSFVTMDFVVEYPIFKVRKTMKEKYK